MIQIAARVVTRGPVVTAVAGHSNKGRAAETHAHRGMTMAETTAQEMTVAATIALGMTDRVMIAAPRRAVRVRIGRRETGPLKIVTDGIGRKERLATSTGRYAMTDRHAMTDRPVITRSAARGVRHLAATSANPSVQPPPSLRRPVRTPPRWRLPVTNGRLRSMSPAMSTFRLSSARYVIPMRPKIEATAVNAEDRNAAPGFGKKISTSPGRSRRSGPPPVSWIKKSCGTCAV